MGSVAAARETHLQQRERGENFPVALRLLPAVFRHDLRAVYDVARTIDDLGDPAPGDPAPADRVALLDDFERDLTRIWSGGRPHLAVNRQLLPTVRRHDLPIDPFVALLTANRLDQRVSSYDTWDDLRGYCALSAEPVGRIVLEIAGAVTPERLAWSDGVCTALQLLEHCQDVAEDRRRGRTYLPAVDRVAHGVMPTDLDAATATPAVRRLIGFEVDRAVALLRAGQPLVRSLRGAPRLAVAGFVAGGLATAAAIRRADGDVLAGTPRPRRRDVARHALALLGGRA